MIESVLDTKRVHRVIVVGAGPAGLGIAILLKRLNIDYIVLERNEIGSSFKKWPKETKFISPSFTGNFFGMPDLNAITPDTSPAFTLSSEHPSGEEYARYLDSLVDFYQLHIKNKINVESVSKEKNRFVLDTNCGQFESKYLVWAAGEYQYPRENSFIGDELCTHFSNIKSFSDLEGESRVIIGGYESGFETAINLAKSGKEVTLLDSSEYLALVGSDSSYTLSPYTKDRIKNIIEYLDYYENTKAEEVKYDGETYSIITSDGEELKSKYKPINCTGFASSLSLVKDLFDHSDGYPLINDSDESTKTKNLFLAGPQVKHGNALFCFIYKYRQRFAILAERLAKEESKPNEIVDEIIQEYKNNNFYLKNLDCCDDECIC